MSNRRKRRPKKFPLPASPAPLPPPHQGNVLRALADLLRFVADRLTDLAGRA